MGDVLDGTAWTLDDGGVGVTAEFDGGRIAGHAGCNRYGGGYRVDGHRFALDGPLVTTLMACPEPAMEVERGVLAALDAAASFSVSDHELVLLDAADRELLRFQTVSDDAWLGAWSVTSIHWPEREAIISTSGELTLTFGDAGVHGSAGCNTFRGPVGVEGRSIEFGPLMTTRMACAPEVMAQEHALLAALTAAVSWRVDGASLHLLRPDGGISVTLRR